MEPFFVQGRERRALSGSKLLVLDWSGQVFGLFRITGLGPSATQYVDPKSAPRQTSPHG